MAIISSGMDFGQAFCAHFGLPLDQVECGIKIEAGACSILASTVTIALTPEDLIGIGKCMQDGQASKAKAAAAKWTEVNLTAGHGQRLKGTITSGFDVWMRERTTQAHRDYMQRHSDGGKAYA